MDPRVRAAVADDVAFVRLMARHAAPLEDRPLPDDSDPDVLECLPIADGPVLVVESGRGERLGAAWWMRRQTPLVPAMPQAPEVCIALTPEARGQGLGVVPLEALTIESRARGASDLVLNVHLRNTAALRLYMKCGFRVAGAGSGWFGVAMARTSEDVPTG